MCIELGSFTHTHTQAGNMIFVCGFSKIALIFSLPFSLSQNVLSEFVSVFVRFALAEQQRWRRREKILSVLLYFYIIIYFFAAHSLCISVPRRKETKCWEQTATITNRILLVSVWACESWLSIVVHFSLVCSAETATNNSTVIQTDPKIIGVSMKCADSVAGFVYLFRQRVKFIVKNWRILRIVIPLWCVPVYGSFECRCQCQCWLRTNITITGIVCYCQMFEAKSRLMLFVLGVVSLFKDHIELAIGLLIYV